MNRRAFLISAAAGVVGAKSALAADPPPSIVLVTADTQSHVVALDPSDGRVLRRIPTARLPRSIERIGPNRALVAHSELGRLTVVDVRTWEARLLGARLDEPRYTALHPAGRYAYLTDAGRHEVVVIDVLREIVVARVAVPGPARHIGVDRSGRRLWSALGTKARDVAVLDLRNPARPRALRTFSPPFLAHDVVFSSDGVHVWVTSGDRGVVAIYRAAGGQLVRTIRAGAPPQHLAFGPGVAYVTRGDDGTLRVHRLDGKPLRTTTIPVGSFNVSRETEVVISPSLERGTLCLLDRHGIRRRIVRVAPAAHDAAVVARW
jgi:DNA-binding beta-propeller fold protein YncE